jgi:DNA repair photolyase
MEIKMGKKAKIKRPTLNLDGVSVKGCTYIYAPRGQAGEYAPLATNPYRGCGHGCAYCYVPNVIKMPRKDFDAGATPRPNFLTKLRKDAAKYRTLGITEQVMFSFTTDVYNPFDTSITRPAIEILIEHGLGFCVLTKARTRALCDRDLYRPDRDAFASTLTSLDERFSRKWERNAALPNDRIAALKAFHERGIFTWVSLEPTLDIEASLAIVEATHDFVDLYKVSRVNYLPMTKTTDWRDYTLRMLDTFDSVNARHYIKKDLQPFLPPAYPNPLRVPQHHGTRNFGNRNAA